MNTSTLQAVGTFSQRAARSLTRHEHRTPSLDCEAYIQAADSYHRMPHRPDAFEVRLAYLYFEAETMVQYGALLDAGLVLQWHTGDDGEYPNSAAMFHDLDNGRLSVRLSEADDLPRDHPMLRRVDGPLTLNDVFRAVHDALGHGLSRGSFGPNGEQNAWLEHRTLYTAQALPALWCETRGQSAWINYYGNHSELPLRDRPFAPQKAGIPARDLI